MGQCATCAIGITPACAGSTNPRQSIRRDNQDHPRVCGEYYVCLGPPFLFEGSPPRVRGVLVRLCALSYWMGITPACAGSTYFPVGLPNFVRDHPRVCGEYLNVNTD